MHEWKIVGIRRAVCYDGIRSVSLSSVSFPEDLTQNRMEK